MERSKHGLDRGYLVPSGQGVMFLAGWSRVSMSWVLVLVGGGVRVMLSTLTKVGCGYVASLRVVVLLPIKVSKREDGDMLTTVVSQKRDQARAAAEVLAAVPGVAGVCVFGSVARGHARVGSDIDLLVLGTRKRLTPSMLLRRLPVELRMAQLSLAYHTADSLDRYLRQWSRFGAHLRREGWILYDPLGELRRLLAADIPVSTTEELAAQRSHLNSYAHLERFGGRFLLTLSLVSSNERTTSFNQPRPGMR
jgi:predicted nucleotidyltransferase